MKRFLALLTLALLLCGCAARQTAPQASDAAEQTAAAETQPLPRLQQKDSGPEGAFCAYGAPQGCFGIRPLGQDLLLLSRSGDGTLLTLCSGADMTLTATAFLDTVPDPEDPSFRTDDQGLSCYDASAGELVLLDEELREIRRIALPQPVVGAPLLAPDRQTVYFSTGDRLCALEAETGICRVLRQEENGGLVLENLLMEGTVLQCSTYDDGLSARFYSARDGQLLSQQPGICTLVSRGSRYIGTLDQEGFPALVFGTGQVPDGMLAETDINALYTLLPDSFAALRLDMTAEGLRLEYFDLETGRMASAAELPGEETFPLVCDGGSGRVWLLSGDGTLYRWDTESLPSGDSGVYTGPYSRRGSPDLAGIAECQALAGQIGQRHGVQILVWEDVFSCQPWDYRMTEEYLVPVLREQLQLLDQRLSNFPEGFLAQMSQHGQAITICLVRSLQPQEQAAAPDSVQGLQYWLEDRPCIALTTLDGSEGSLYHELCHVFDTRVFGRSNAYDQWEELNPSGFEYDYDYEANAQRNAGEYLRDAERCFIDTYSMSFPKEDRARVLEYAMTEGNAHYFQSETMQNKLRQICIGLREAFGLKKSPETFLWEQYLQESLAYGG